MYRYKSGVSILFIAGILANSYSFSQDKATAAPRQDTDIVQIILFILITCLILALIFYVLNKRQKRKFNE